MSFHKTSGNHATHVEMQCPLCKKCVKNNYFPQQHRKFLSLSIDGGNGNVQGRTFYHTINYVFHDVVPNFPQRSILDVATITNDSYQSIEDYVAQQPRQPLSANIVEGINNVPYTTFYHKVNSISQYLVRNFP